jgi:hypothetical protein
MKQAQSYSDGSVILVASISAEDAISSARGRLADEHGAKIISIRIPMRRGSGTHRNRMVCRARRANSKETGGRRPWDEGLCVRNPWLNQEGDGRTRGTGAVGKKTRWRRLGWGKGQ